MIIYKAWGDNLSPSNAIHIGSGDYTDQSESSLTISHTFDHLNPIWHGILGLKLSLLLTAAMQVKNQFNLCNEDYQQD
jgi:hypothetical protein